MIVHGAPGGAEILGASLLLGAPLHEGGVAAGFASGLLHPITGPDHLVAMVAVGLWGAQLGRPAIWVLPIAFPAVMALGGMLGIAKVAVPGVELGIALSAVVLGAMVALAAAPPLWLAAAVVGVFAVCHGHAHGTELHEAHHPAAYAVGFVLATGALHAAGIAIGTLVRSPRGAVVVRACGLVIAVLGVVFVAPWLG